MTDNESYTFQSFISSNKDFSDAIINNKPLVLDIILKLELIIYYLTVNKKYLTKPIVGDKAPQLISLIENQNFVIENDCLICEGITYHLENLIKLVFHIEKEKEHTNPEKNIIYLNTSHREIKPSKPIGKCRVIEFSGAKRRMVYTMNERGTIFEHLLTVDDETLPYIEEINNNYIALVSDIVKHALKDDLSDYNHRYLKLIIAYLNIYPFTTYLINKKRIPFESLRLPQNAIGIRKTTHNNDYINDLEQHLLEIADKEKRLLYERDRYEKDTSYSANLLTRIEQELKRLEKEKLNYSFGLYLIKNTPELYNENLLTYIAKSFESGYVEINRFFVNPIIKLFYIDNNKVEFHSSLKLDTIINLFNPEELSKSIYEVKRLKKEG